MKKQLFYLLTLSLLVLSAACSDRLIGPQMPSSPVTNFDYLWSEYDRLYGAFGPKKIDWNALYKRYRSQLSEQTTNAELYRTMTALLDHLDDNHVYLRPTSDTGLPWYEGGILGRTTVEDYDSEVVSHYLVGTRTYTDEFFLGKLPDNLGYMLLKGFERDYVTYNKTMDSVLTYFQDTKGLIIDLRENGGGEDRVAQYIANRFATERHLSFTARLRNGPRHTDFGPETSVLHRTGG